MPHNAKWSTAPSVNGDSVYGCPTDFYPSHLHAAELYTKGVKVEVSNFFMTTKLLSMRLCNFPHLHLVIHRRVDYSDRHGTIGPLNPEPPTHSLVENVQVPGWCGY